MDIDIEAKSLSSWSTERPLLLYGAGHAGRGVARGLEGAGIRPCAFLDAGARPGQFAAGIPVHRLADWVKENDPGEVDVLVSLHSANVPVADVVGDLRVAGFPRILTMWDYVNRFPRDPETRYWLCAASFYDDKAERLSAARALFTDPASLRWFDGVMRLRREGDYAAPPPPNFEEHYVPGDLPRWAEPMRLIDGGAFDGDSLALMLRHGYALGAVAAFEPDPVNYARLAARYRHLNGIFLPCGLAGATGQLRFDADQTMSSRLDAQGECAIQCVTIDEALPAFAPSLIKMDIEGAEPAALQGAERTLRRYRPGLAISLYHSPEHLWEIPLWIAGLGLGYEMFMRGHGHNGFELVLYCRPT
jgi:FkbM family methyltransferase